MFLFFSIEYTWFASIYGSFSPHKITLDLTDMWCQYYDHTCHTARKAMKQLEDEIVEQPIFCFELINGPHKLYDLTPLDYVKSLG